MTDGPIDPGTVHADPLDQFRAWFADARDAGVHEPEAMVLSTASPDGVPSARVVLMRGADADGFRFFTNYESRKGRDLAANPRACATFHWHPPGRQVRIEGPVSVVDDAVADAYWQSRPRGSRIGAWASDQSQPVTDRGELDRRRAEAEARFGTTDDGDPIERPPYWGGYLVGIDRIEFWQGQPNRLHDRFEYRADGAGGWEIQRLAP